VIRWAQLVQPRIIVLENVEEFEDWGPVIEVSPGRFIPDPDKRGLTFKIWLGRLKGLGYEVEFTSLVAADYGAPTIRRRLFLIARRDRQPILWPEATHGEGTGRDWKPASDIIDWSLPCPSIFERSRPLAEATMKRIAIGVKRFVIDEQEPFIIRTGHYSKRTGAGLREGCGAGTFRGQSLRRPVATLCATNDKNLVVPLISKHYTGVVGHSVRRTLGTVTSIDHHALTSAFLTKYYGTAIGAKMSKPLPTVTGQGNHIGEVRAFLTKYYGGGKKKRSGVAQGLRDPLHTVRGKDCFGLVEVHGEQYRIHDIGMRMLQPHELSAAQGFPDSYEIAQLADGTQLTKEAQIRMIGNSVSPPNAEAIVREVVQSV
jgi:DNA (cytosine-5)-methyltransferase 1